MLSLRIARCLLPLFALTVLTGCATLPESAYFQPNYDESSYPTVSPGTGGWNYKVHYSLLFVPPTFTTVAGIDGKIVRKSFWLGSTTMPIPPGKHVLILECDSGEKHTFSELPVVLAPNAQYSAKSEYTSKDLQNMQFYIEDKATKQRIAQGPATRTFCEMRVPIFIPVVH